MQEVTTIKGILKPMPDYGSHLRAGVEFRRYGREYIVDDAEADAKIKAALKTLSERSQKALDAAAAEGNEAARDQIRRQHDEEMAKLRAGVYDEPGEPLLLTSKGFEYMRGAFGVHLVNEPWDGNPRPLEVKPMTEAEERREILAELRRLNQRVGVLEAKGGPGPKQPAKA